MDQSDYPSLPRLNVLHAQLAAQSRRVSQVVDLQLETHGPEQHPKSGRAPSIDAVEQLFSAATAQDWTRAASAIERLAHWPKDPANADLVHAAEVVTRALRTDEPDAIASHLGTLLAECRSWSYADKSRANKSRESSQ